MSNTTDNTRIPALKAARGKILHSAAIATSIKLHYGFWTVTNHAHVGTEAVESSDQGLGRTCPVSKKVKLSIRAAIKCWFIEDPTTILIMPLKFLNLQIMATT